MAKIVHLTSVSTTFHVRIFARQCRSLAAAGNEVVLICTHDCDEIVDGVRIKTVGKPTGRLQRMIWTTFRLIWAASAERADLYVIHDPELIPMAWLFSLFQNVVVYDMHENTPKQILSKSWIPRLLRRPVAWSVSVLERLFLAQIPIVFAESSYQKDYRYAPRAATVLNMPRIGECAKKYARPTIGYMGGVSPLRGSVVTLEALQRLKRRGLSLDFECIGPVSRGHAEELRKRSHLLQPADIRIHGYKLPGEGWDTIARCHIGLAVLSNVPNYYESFPGKMFEYMSFGLPVIVSNFPLYREIVEKIDCGICVAPDTPDELADAIEWLITHPKEAQAMGQRGKLAIEATYNWHVEFEKLLDFYDKCLLPQGIYVSRKATKVSSPQVA